MIKQAVLKYRKKRNDEEYQTQKAAVKWFRLSYPQYKRCLQASANGMYLGDKGYIFAAKAKASGMVTGQSDLFIALARGDYYGKYIEVKAGKGKERPEQAFFGNDMRENGYDYEVVLGLDNLISCIYKYINLPPTAILRKI